MPKNQDVVIVGAAGEPEVLRLERLIVPTPADGQVLIEVHVAGVNRHDCNQRRAGPGHASTDVLGLEVAGRVIAAGDALSQRLVGERVCALVDGGGYGEYCIAETALCFELPDSMDYLTAACLPEALFTTWFNFFEIARLSHPGVVLIHGGASGVGSVAIQALTWLGYEVAATCGDQKKCDAAVKLGAIGACNYHSETLTRDILDVIGGRTVDVIMDMSAGAHIASDIDVLSRGGRIVHLSSGGSKPMSVPLGKLMAKKGSIAGALLRAAPLGEKVALAERLRAEIWGDIQSAVTPVVATVLPLAEAAAAHRFMESGQAIGKILLKVRDAEPEEQ